MVFFVSSRRRHTRCALVMEFRRVLFRSSKSTPRWAAADLEFHLRLISARRRQTLMFLNGESRETTSAWMLLKNSTASILTGIKRFHRIAQTRFNSENCGKGVAEKAYGTLLGGCENGVGLA